MNLSETFDACRSALASSRFSFTNEAELQDGIASALGSDERITYIREAHLSKADRPDFFLPSVGLTIEVKIDGGLTPLIRQLHRYAGLECVKGIMVVTTRAALALLPSSLGLSLIPVQSVVIRRGLR